jgi:transcriptional regulator with PAS, ATPase and Fis domain
MSHLINTSEVDELISSIKGEKQITQIKHIILSENILEYITNISTFPIFIQDFVNELERYILINILEYTNLNKSKAAKILKINYKTLYYKMKKFNI